jgi:hypothetical protein
MVIPPAPVGSHEHYDMAEAEAARDGLRRGPRAVAGDSTIRAAFPGVRETKRFIVQKGSR